MGITIKPTHSTREDRSIWFSGSVELGKLILDVTAGNKAYCHDLTIEQAAEIRDFLNKEFPATPPKPTVAEQIKALAVGDQFTIDYENGNQVYGIKVDDENWFSYVNKLLGRIEHITWAGTVTKS